MTGIRFPLGFQIVFAVILIAGVLAYPESPRWQVTRGASPHAY